MDTNSLHILSILARIYSLLTVKEGGRKGGEAKQKEEGDLFLLFCEANSSFFLVKQFFLCFQFVSLTHVVNKLFRSLAFCFIYLNKYLFTDHPAQLNLNTLEN